MMAQVTEFPAFSFSLIPVLECEGVWDVQQYMEGRKDRQEGGGGGGGRKRKKMNVYC